MKYTLMKNTKINIVVLFILLLLVSGCGEKNKDETTIVPGSSILPAPSKAVKVEDVSKEGNEFSITGILTKVTKEDMKLQFVDILSGTEYEATYNNGTSIKSKHDAQMSVSGLEIGNIYDVVCNADGRANSIIASKSAWKKSELSDVVVDENDKDICYGSAKFRYSPNIVVVSGENRINITQIVKQDEVNLYGIDNTVYSVNVEKSHGYIRFTGVDAFIGGYASIGKAQLISVTKDMIVTSRTGSYTVELQLGSLVGTKEVIVEEGKETVVDFSEYSWPAQKQGAINFKVTPSTAIMTIDGDEVDYKDPIQLPYGKHEITLVENHYKKYEAVIVVNNDFVTKVIDMVPSDTSSGTTTKNYKMKITEPVGAAAYVDSIYMGIIPCSFEKTPGNKTITLKKDGYTTVSYGIMVDSTNEDVTYVFPDMKKSEENSNSEDESKSTE